MAIYMLDVQFATQGPAPDGFHVPLNTEWQAVYDVWTALGGGNSDGTNFGKALKLPFAGRRSYSSADVSNQGTHGYYWSSSRRDASYAYILSFGSSSLYPQNYSFYRANGFSVRCFKNSPVIPTSSWTKLYGTSIESGGIFWNSSKGLISLSSDGQIWITIADKNLGATTVWNNGDTLSEANCGKYYQRGNNYGFPRTGTIANQSTTQVDASNYGPGNYYSNDTFIKYSGRWDSTDNGNLRGGVDGNVPVQNEPKKIYKGSTEIKAVYLGTTKVRPKWKPGANTVAYYPLKENLNDYSGNNNHFSIDAGTVSYSNNMATISERLLANSVLSGYNGDFTILAYTQLNNAETGYMFIGYSGYNPSAQFGLIGNQFKLVWDNGGWRGVSPSYTTSGVHLAVAVKTSTKITLYIDGAEFYTSSGTWNGMPTYGKSFLGRNRIGTGSCKYGNLIVENKARTAQEIADYYNSTKSNYGL